MESSFENPPSSNVQQYHMTQQDAINNENRGGNRSKRVTLDEKFEFITDRLQNHFPIKTVYVIGVIMILIGIAAIVLQIILIVNQAIHYEIGNGIWGGCFAIISGLLKINMGIFLPKFYKYSRLKKK